MAEDELLPDSVIKQEGDKFSTRVSCDAELFPMLIGKGGDAKRRIEAETGAQLIFPRRDSPAAQQQDVTIKAATKLSLSRAHTRLSLAMESALSSGRLVDYNYFVSLPLANAASIAAFGAFRDQVVSDPQAASRGIDPTIFVAPQHLHLTIAMLKLYSDERRQKAKQALQALQPQVAELLAQGGPLQVQLRELEYMNDDPSSMHVLYLQVHEVGPGGRLARLCELLVGALSRAGLLLPQDDRPVKLHATVINTRYRKGGGGPVHGGPKNFKERIPFDGTLLLEQHGKLDLGVHTLPAIHISQRGAYDSQTGYYKSFHVMEMGGA